MAPHNRQALITATATTFAALLAFALHVDDPWWAAISAFIVSQSSTAGMLTKAALRVAGTIAGCLIAVFLGVQLAGEPLQLALFVLFLFTLGVYKRFTSQYSYAWFLGCLTAALILVVSVTQPEAIAQMALYRGIEISIGVLVAAAVNLCAAPFTPGSDAPAADPGPVTDRAAHIAAIQVGVFGGILFLVMLTVLDALAFPSVSQILISTGVILGTSIDETRKTAWLRALGAFAGGVLGLAVTSLSIESLPLWSIVFFAGIALCANHHHSPRPNAYIGTQAAIAFIVAMITGNAPVSELSPVIDRVAAISVAATFVAIMSYVVAPWVRPRTPAPPANAAT